MSDPSRTNNDESRKPSPPAFLDLADSAARLGTNMPDISARVELKRLEKEHERQRVAQWQAFEDQRRMLELQQAQERLGLPYDPNSPNGNATIAVSAPTTPPRLNVPLADMDPSKTVTSTADKRKSVTYAPSVNLSPELGGPTSQSLRAAGAKSMPASRRTSASEHDEDLAAHLQGLSMAGERSMPVPQTAVSVHGQTRYGEGYPAYNAGVLLDQELDQEMQTAMRHLPTSDEDKFHFQNKKFSASSAALDLAHGSQTSPRSSFARAHGHKESSEWPQFTGAPRAPEPLSRAGNRRSINGHELALAASGLGGLPTSASTPLLGQHGSPNLLGLPSSRRNSPPGFMDALARSVPATPLGLVNSVLKTPGTPLSPEVQALGSRISSSSSIPSSEGSQGPLDIQASLSRQPSSHYDPYNQYDDGFNIQDPLHFGGNMDNRFYGASPTSTSGSTALYHHNGTRYGLGVGRNSVGDAKLNGLHGAKHKRGDMDLNRFAGTRLEDLQGEIPTLCKDQHGCRYLQKKLEEGLPEHRDMIFNETCGHFSDLMTDPFGNYLCQKLLEYSSDEQRNIICESVAKDLVNISLNMHGTRAVQKMIDFLSTRRMASFADSRFHDQIHSIIMALSLHVVVLIKDLNGNHVIQKCLNKLAPEDNQFIYNAVAANCVEVATHRHGCCVLQRCIDHASEAQRVQLVNEITYNALTLVQDPYGNYVVQYILDLNDNRFSDGVIRQFAGNVCALSVQKFSSNVIEKCVRVAEQSTRKLLIEELLNRSRLEKLLKDSYGNYCVQTALDYAEPAQRALLVEGIRPVLPLIRNTPYGKRIQNKLQREHMDHFGGGGGGYHHQPPLGNIGLGNGSVHGSGPHHSQSRHMMQSNQLTDMYNQPSLYSMSNQGSYSPSLQSLQAQSTGIDSYVLNGNAGHHAPSLSGSSFSGASYAAFNGNSDPYQARSTAFAYGM
ncbi:ARM repeat-containing protein [Flagelloscypha sp. PMI_526]|nr:ARM repeat-containing protein [Flagelloscypha sp. PMI_526]